MITVVLPDGTKKSYQSASGLKVAEDISPRLASAALAAKIDGALLDNILDVCLVSYFTY